MAAHSYIRLGSEFLFAVREGYSTELASIFLDSERQETSGQSEEDAATIQFVATARQMRERLQALGYTTERAGAAVDRFYADEPERSRDEMDGWIALLVTSAENDEWSDLPAEPHVWVDPRLLLRLIVDAASDHLEVALDVSQPVARRFVSAPPDLCASAFAEELGASAGFGTLVVLTEGSTDAEFLAGALDVLRPHVSPYVRFLDYGTNRPEGGASALVKMVKAFASAEISNRIVALFDNDTAAAQDLLFLSVESLPDHFRVLQLPDLEMASTYPTIGPTGLTDWDVNGCAGSLELYLGQDVLTDEQGETVPVQWSGFLKKVGRYQGELTDKRGIQDRFREKLAEAKIDGVVDLEVWSDLELVLDAILES